MKWRRVRSVANFCFGLGIATSTAGCGTLLSMGMNHDPEASQIYGGTRVDIVVPLAALRIIPTEAELPAWTFAWSLLLLDLPISFVADTVLLPFTVYHHVAVRGKRRDGDAEKSDSKNGASLPPVDGKTDADSKQSR